MKSWLLSVLGAVILTSVLSMVLPEGKTKKAVSNIYSLVAFVIIFKGISFITLDLYKNNFNIEIQEDLLVFVNSENKKILEDDCIKILENYGIKNSVVTIIYGLNDNNVNVPKSVIINLRSAVIISVEEHIDIIDKAKKNIAEYFDIEQKNVVIQL